MLTAQRQGKILDEISKKTVGHRDRAVRGARRVGVNHKKRPCGSRQRASLKGSRGAVALTAELISAEPDVGKSLSLT